jgi:mycofactocin precursor
LTLGSAFIGSAKTDAMTVMSKGFPMAPVEQQETASEEPVVEETLVEEVSIDEMCASTEVTGDAVVLR